MSTRYSGSTQLYNGADAPTNDTTQEAGDGSISVSGKKAYVTQYDFSKFRGAPTIDVTAGGGEYGDAASEAAAKKYHADLTKFLADNNLKYYVKETDNKSGWRHWIENDKGQLVGREQFFRNDDDFMKYFAPAAGLAFLPSLGASLAGATGMSAGLANTVVGGAFSAATGGNPKDIITNALLQPALSSVPGFSSLPMPVQTGITSGARAVVRGQDPLTAALSGVVGQQTNPVLGKLLGLLLARKG